MQFAKWVYRIAAIYGVLVLLPLYFVSDNPLAVPLPAMTHPEYYFAFLGSALVFQTVFWVIASDPMKYRALMVPAMLEKAVFPGQLLVMALQGRFPQQLLLGGSLDFLLGCLFLASFLKTGKRA